MSKISFKETIRLCKSDLTRYHEPFLKCYLFTPGFKYTVNHRLCFYYSQHTWLKPLFVFQWLYMKHLTYKFGIQTSWKWSLPEDFTIAHFGGITFFPESCGAHPYLRQGVTVGSGHGGNPTIGEHVEFGANSIVVGNIKVGDYAMIGAGAVVTKDVPPYAVVGGVPAKVIKYKTKF